MKNLSEYIKNARPIDMAMLNTAFIEAPHLFALDTIGIALPLKRVGLLVEALPPENLPPDIGRSAWKRKLSFVGGRLCAEAALARFGLPGAAVERDPDGVPVWPKGVAGSIAHTDHFAYAVVCKSIGDVRLGIDSEPIFSDATLHDVSQLCCTRDEKIRLLNTANCNLLGTIIFSAKESIYKAIHSRVNRYVDFCDIEITAIDWQRSWIQLHAANNDLHPVLAQCHTYFSIGNNAVHTSVQMLAAQHAPQLH